MRRTAFALNKVLESFNQIAAVQSRELQQTLVALRSRVNAVDSVRIDSTMRSMQAASKSLESFTGELQTASAKFNGILNKMENGDGSLSKLMNDPGLYNDLRRVATRVDSLMLDLMKNPRKYLKFSVF
jgi:phospholipid/cholesterol/gamma-HCH transport system substrate-binding protein